MRCEGERGACSRPCLLQLVLERNGNPSKIPFTCLQVVNENELLGIRAWLSAQPALEGPLERAEHLALHVRLADRETEAQSFPEFGQVS